MTLKRALLVLVLTALAALSGCGDNGDGDRGAAVDPGLGPITYVVTGVTIDGKPHPLVEDTEIRIRFADARVTIGAGCNTMSGRYQLEETRLTVRDLATTDMGCDQARMEQDTWLAGLFEKPVQLMTGAEPSIVSGSTVLTMADREKVAPDKPLAGTKWLLDTVYDGDTASSAPRGVDGWIVFDDHGGVRADDGCNTGAGSVRVGDATLTFGDIVWKLAECAPVPPDLRSVLTGAATYSIEENSLTITRGARGLGFHAVERLPDR